MRRPFARLGLALFSLLVPSGGAAHSAQFTTLLVRVEPAGRFRATLNVDVLAYAIGKPSIDATNEELEALLAGPRLALAQALADAGEHFRHEVVVRTDAGDALIDSFTLPGMPQIDAALARKIEPRILMSGEIALSGILPAKAHTLSVRLPYVLGETVQMCALPDGRSYGELVAAGSYSSAVALDPPLPETAGLKEPKQVQEPGRQR